MGNLKVNYVFYRYLKKCEYHLTMISCPVSFKDHQINDQTDYVPV